MTEQTEQPMYRTRDLMAHAGIAKRQAQYWIEKGWLEPDNPRTGTGQSFWFTAAMLERAKLMAFLDRCGFEEVKAHEVATIMLAQEANYVFASDQGYRMTITSTRGD